ncbi:hypothetical protein GCM10027297_10590 [Parahaliea aestuarii]
MGEQVASIRCETDRANKLSEAQKASLSYRLKQYPATDEGLVVAALINWGLRLCEGKTLFGSSVKFSTVVSYQKQVIRVLRRAQEIDDIQHWQPNDFEDFYLDTVERHQQAGQKLAGRLMDFDVEIGALLGREEGLDWSSIISNTANDPDRLEQRIDANIITEAEYTAALDAIARLPECSELHSAQISFLLILGFRFGLRWSEAFFLEVRDLQYSRKFVELFVQIRKNRFRELKSLSATRRVPLVGALSDRETSSISTVLGHAETWRQENPLALLMQRSGGCDDRIDEGEAAQVINTTLKRVSGDRTLRYHHGRHTFASRLMTVALIERTSEEYVSVLHHLAPNHYYGETALENLWHQEASLTQKLNCIAEVIGHKGIVPTTVGSYVHVHDLILRNVHRSRRGSAEVEATALSYMLGVKRAAIRQARSRAAQEGRPFDPIKTYFKKANGFDQIDEKKPPVNDRLAKVPPGDSRTYTIHEVFDLLQGFARETSSLLAGEAGLISRPMFELCQLAQSIERQSGYTGFNLYVLTEGKRVVPLPRQDLLKAPNQNECERVRRMLSVFGERWQIWSEAEREIAQVTIREWTKANQPRAAYLLFEDSHSLGAFLHGLSIFGVPHYTWEVLVPKGCESLREDWSDVCPDVFNYYIRRDHVVRQLPGASPVYQAARLGLRLKNPIGRALDRGDFRRYMFVIATFLAHKSPRYRVTELLSMSCKGSIFREMC